MQFSSQQLAAVFLGWKSALWWSCTSGTYRPNPYWICITRSKVMVPHTQKKNTTFSTQYRRKLIRSLGSVFIFGACYGLCVSISCLKEGLRLIYPYWNVFWFANSMNILPWTKIEHAVDCRISRIFAYNVFVTYVRQTPVQLDDPFGTCIWHLQ